MHVSVEGLGCLVQLLIVEVPCWLPFQGCCRSFTCKAFLFAGGRMAEVEQDPAEQQLLRGDLLQQSVTETSVRWESLHGCSDPQLGPCSLQLCSRRHLTAPVAAALHQASYYLSGLET